MKLIAFGASNSSTSINKALASYAASIVADAADADVEVQILDLNDYEMPIYSSDREAADGIPRQAQAFLDVIDGADAAIVSFAEHNGLFTAAYKNIFDWASRINMAVYQDTPVIFLSTSPGGTGAANALATAVKLAPYGGAQVKGSFSIPSFYDNVDAETGAVTNPELDAELRKVLAGLL